VYSIFVLYGIVLCTLVTCDIYKISALLLLYYDTYAGIQEA